MNFAGFDVMRTEVTYNVPLEVKVAAVLLLLTCVTIIKVRRREICEAENSETVRTKII